ncbi:MAG TPA: ABC transporter substrate-binding protein [Chloroflexota bacterium]|nr:ABC transporter substrate-binding protein [Chloroflexota bacterium]
MRRALAALAIFALAACGGTTAPASGAPPAASVPALASAGAKPASSGLTEVRIGYQATINSAPTFVGVDEGLFAARGLKVSMTPVSGTEQTMVAMANGQLDMGNVSFGIAALNALSRGADLKIVTSGTYEAPGHAAFAPLMVRSDLFDSGQVTTVAQVKGHKLALNSRGGGQEYSLYRALKTGGLTPNDVDIIAVPWPEMVSAFANRALDAGLVAHPIADQAISKGVAKIISDDYLAGSQGAGIMANSKFLEQHFDAAVNFIAVLVQLQRKFNNGGLKKDDQALAILEKYSKISPEVTRQAPDPYWPPDGRDNIKDLEAQQAYYMETKGVSYTQPLDFTKIVDERALDAALKTLN